jgi:methylphosphotriester-DNA--protein-cysteine methyltransferase
MKGSIATKLIALFGRSPSWTIAWAGRRVSRQLVEKSEEETEKARTNQFVGRINSNVFHFPSCAQARKIEQARQIWFSSSEDARKQGYKPCKICHPE